VFAFFTTLEKNTLEKIFMGPFGNNCVFGIKKKKKKKRKESFLSDNSLSYTINVLLFYLRIEKTLSYYGCFLFGLHILSSIPSLFYFPLFLSKPIAPCSSMVFVSLSDKWI